MRLRAVGILAALALVAAGCGSKSSSSGSLDDALRFLPKDAPLVMAFDTDPDGGQWQQVDELLGKFPFAGTFKEKFKQGINRAGNFDYDKDIKPLLGNDLVVGLTSVASAPTAFVIVWKPADEDAFRKLIVKTGLKKGADLEGADVFESPGGDRVAIKDGTAIVASPDPKLGEFLKRADGGDHLTEAEFRDNLGDLDGDALVRATGNLQSLYQGRFGAAWQKLEYTRAEKSSGFVVKAEPDGIEVAFASELEGDLQEADLPLSPGAEPVPVVRRAGEIGFGLRDPAHTLRFYEAAFKAVSPSIYNRLATEKAKLGKQLRVNVDRELIGQLTGNLYVSVALDGGFALRADLRDPAAATKTLKRVAPRLKKLALSHGKRVSLIAPKSGKGFYALASADGKKVAFGVVGKSFVLATDAARAAQFAGQSPTTVPGTKGALVVAADARSVANKIAEQQGQGTAAQIVTGALGDLIGWVDQEPDHSVGRLKLFIK